MTPTRSATLRDHAEIVRDQEHGQVVVRLEPAQERQDLRLDRHVERGRRLVRDQERRASTTSAIASIDALLHPSGQLVRRRTTPGAPGREARPPRAAAPPRARPPCATAPCGCGATRRPACRSSAPGSTPRPAPGTRSRSPPPRTPRISFSERAGQVAPLEHDPSAGDPARLDEAQDRVGRRGLPAPGFADERVGLARRERPDRDRPPRARRRAGRRTGRSSLRSTGGAASGVDSTPARRRACAARAASRRRSACAPERNRSSAAKHRSAASRAEAGRFPARAATSRSTPNSSPRGLRASVTPSV